MTEPITDAELDEWERIERSGTPGPWDAEPNGFSGGPQGVWYQRPGHLSDVALLSFTAERGFAYCAQARRREDELLIATARNAFPRLIDEVQEYRFFKADMLKLMDFAQYHTEELQATPGGALLPALLTWCRLMLEENRKLRAHLIDTVGEDGLADVLE